MRYVALLRGVNVGGNSKVDMTELKSVFESTGLTDVQTYINSGNVVFASERFDRDRLSEDVGRAISAHFGFDVPLLLKDVDEVRSIVEAIPAQWANNGVMKCDVLFLWKEVDRPEVLEELPINTTIEDTIYTPGAVVRRVDKSNASRSRLPKIVGTPLYRLVTIRNCNTARKLLQLLEQ